MDNKNNVENEAVGKKGGLKGLVSSFTKLDTKKKIQYVVILLIIIVIMTIYFSSFKSSPTDNNAEPPSASDKSSLTSQQPDLASELEETLSKIEGAGKVKVMITYESSPEKVPAYSVDKQTSSTSDTSTEGSNTTISENTQSDVATVNGSGGDSALILKENNPEIKGVIVVAEGADSIQVKLDLLKAVETVLNVSPDKVDVYKMNNE